MNVLQILPELNVGGVETGTVDLCKYLVRLGHKAVVVSAGGELVKELETNGAKHYTLAVNKKSFLHIQRAIPQVYKIIKEENIDLVHARSRVPAWIGFFAARKAEVPFITTCHGYYAQHFFSRAMGWGKLVIVPSEVVATHMLEHFGVPRQRMRLIPRGVDLEKFEFISPYDKVGDIFNVGIIARLSPIKGHTYFLRAIAKVVRHFNRPKIKIWIIGDAAPGQEDYKEELRILVRRLGLEHCTEFLGTQRDIPTILAHLNLLVAASIIPEAFGRVLLEAGASGVPVVATRVGGFVDILKDGENGILVAPADCEEMSEAIIQLVKNVHLADKLARNAYVKVKEKFNAQLMVERTLEVYQEAVSSFNILLIKLGSLGDVILSTAALRHLRERFSQQYYKIKVLVGKESKDIFKNCPYLDELFVYDYRDREGGIRPLWNKAQFLRKENFDIVIDLQNNRRSHLLAYLSMSPRRYGYDNKKFAFLLNHRIKDNHLPLDPVSHQFRVLEMLGIQLKDAHLELWPSQEDRRYVEEFLSSVWLGDTDILVGINLSASRRWQTKTWPDNHLIKLCNSLSLKGYRIVFTGTEKDLPRAEELSRSLKTAKPIIACGKTTVNQLVCLIRRCNVFISADSAPLHIANSQDTPFIALFGPTDYRRHLPPFKKGVVLAKALPCAPCYRPKCRHKTCMQLIKPQEVEEKIEELLKR